LPSVCARVLLNLLHAAVQPYPASLLHIARDKYYVAAAIQSQCNLDIRSFPQCAANANDHNQSFKRKTRCIFVMTCHWAKEKQLLYPMNDAASMMHCQKISRVMTFYPVCTLSFQAVAPICIPSCTSYYPLPAAADVDCPCLQISSCDNILATMEDMLGKFQADLGNISTEIRALQEQSQTMSIKLKNRKGTEQKLSNFIESVAIPPNLIDGILQTEVDETFHEHLLSLHRKLNFLEKNEAAQNSAAYKDVAPELEKLRVKAISKCRDYLMQRIYALRKPKTNIQILQQNVLLKYKYLVTFLRLHGGEVFGEVRTAYIDTLSRVLSSHFRAYLAAIERLKVGL